MEWAPAAQQNKFIKLILLFNQKCLIMNEIGIQKEAMDFRELHYERRDYQKVSNGLIQINDNLKLLWQC
jgi:hypothetical protein